MLFDCRNDELGYKRQQLWQHVVNVAPQAMVKDLESMNSDDRLVYIISGFKSTYLTEWLDLYQMLCNFVFQMYTECQKIKAEFDAI